MPLVQSVGRLLSTVGPVGRLLTAVGPVGRLLSAVGPATRGRIKSEKTWQIFL